VNRVIVLSFCRLPVFFVFMGIPVIKTFCSLPPVQVFFLADDNISVAQFLLDIRILVFDSLDYSFYDVHFIPLIRGFGVPDSNPLGCRASVWYEVGFAHYRVPPCTVVI
jgi:hypothetical protein